VLQQLFPRYARYAEAVTDAELQPFAILEDGVKAFCDCCLRPYGNATALFFFALLLPTVT